jgi:hypothetical protein
MEADAAGPGGEMGEPSMTAFGPRAGIEMAPGETPAMEADMASAMTGGRPNKKRGGEQIMKGNYMLFENEEEEEKEPYIKNGRNNNTIPLLSNNELAKNLTRFENLGARGGANKRGPARTFKLIKIDGKPTNLDHHATLYERTKEGKPKKVSLTSVARKVFRQVCRGMGKKADCKLNFTIVETTREVDNMGHLKAHNERTYNGMVEKKKKPTTRKLPNGKVVVNKFNYKVKHVPVGSA